jgi:hypothetical protein
LGTTRAKNRLIIKVDAFFAICGMLSYDIHHHRDHHRRFGWTCTARIFPPRKSDGL